MSKILHKSDNPFSPLLFIQPVVIQYLQIIGIALIAISIIYLLAANWWMLPKFVQLFIPQILLLASAILSIRLDTQAVLRQSLDAVSALMLGLSLAVIGQIYQTGADSYQLFLLWAVLLLPWLYRPNIGVFVLFCLVSQLALYFYFKQSFWLIRAETAYFLMFNIFTGLSFLFALRYYPVLRYLFILLIVFISILSMFRFIDSDSIWYLSSVLVLPILFSVYFYTRKQQLETSLLVAGMALSFSILIFDLTEQYLQESALSLLVLAILIFGWFAGISTVLMKLLPKSKFSVIPMALGAWIAGVILAVLLLTYWESFSIFMGIIFIGVAWWLIHVKSSIFLRQFAYCLWVCGQAAILIHGELLTESWPLIWLIQLGIMLVTILSRMHWWIVFLQLLLTHVLTIIALYSVLHNDHLMTIAMSINWLVLIVVLLTAGYWLQSHYSRSIQLWSICVLAVMAVFQTLFHLDHRQITEQGAENVMVFYILPIIWLFSFILVQRHQFTRHDLWLIPVLGTILIWLGYFEILVILMLMAWAIAYRQSLIQALSILLLIFWLWMLYYNLGLSFLFKSISIFASGILVLGLAHILKQPKLQHAQGKTI
ncbi:DUF2157 domain-containing protein [Acinetobacter sp. 197]|uniref:DUF2157 domain-containing protein n=1 Tax=Acinetobacter sp. 197 TaxID=3114696 RepID=UPI003A882EE8